MATFYSDQLANGALPFRGKYEGSPEGFTAKVVIPAGTDLASGDVLKFARVAPDIQITKVIIRSSDLDEGGSPTLTGDIGYVRALTKPFEAYNATTNPYIDGSVAVDDVDHFANAASAPFQAGGVSSLEWEDFAVKTPINGLADLAITFDANSAGAITDAGYVELIVEYIGKARTAGTFSGATAYNYTENFYT